MLQDVGHLNKERGAGVSIPIESNPTFANTSLMHSISRLDLDKCMDEYSVADGQAAERSVMAVFNYLVTDEDTSAQ